MRQLVGAADDAEGAPTTVRELLVSLAPPAVRAAAARLAVAERAGRRRPDALRHGARRLGRPRRLRRRGALGRVRDPGRRARPDRAVADRPLRTFSGGEQKRMALEVLLRGDDDILLLDEPDNFLDVPAKRWLERELAATRKTVLYVSHDRELLAATATKIVTVEAEGAWTHGGGFAGYAEARQAPPRQAAAATGRCTTTSASGSRSSSPR